MNRNFSIKKHWPTCLEVNLSNIRHNVKELKKKVGPNVCLMATVKAEAYGHGMVEVAKIALQNGAQKLAVANVDEGIALRQEGITEPILVFVLAFEDAIEDIVRFDLMQTVIDIDFAKKLSQEAIKQNKTVKININVNTGMNRNGIEPNKTLDFINEINSYDNIQIEGIYTHLSTSTIEKEFTNTQFDMFKEVLDMLEDNNIDIPYKHCCNTGGVLNFPHMYLNQVRPGLLITTPFGALEKEDDLDLKESFEFKSKITILRKVGKGQSIGYDQMYYSNKNIKIAVVCAGWGDGIPRELSNKGFALINGFKCPILGRIDCDQFFADVTNIPDVQVGDEVVIIGKQKDLFISANEWGQLIGGVSSHITLRCLMTNRVRREYIN